MKNIIKIGREQIVIQIRKMKENLAVDNQAVINREAHTLKGMAANFSAQRLRDAAYEESRAKLETIYAERAKNGRAKDR